MSIPPPYFTVFTPTFNRAHTLGFAYNSLCDQTYKDFEWIIVDDGSADGTEDLVRRWIEEERIGIRYFRQANQGKHVAHNLAVDKARGTLFVVLDSDDRLVTDALEKLKRHWEAIPKSERDRFSTVTGLCIDNSGRVIGGEFPAEVNDVEDVPEQIRLRSLGERFGANSTKVMREYKFPVFKDEKFMAEAIVWNRISSRYKTRFINERLRIFESLDDGLTANSVAARMKSPNGTVLYYQEKINLPIGMSERLKAAANCVRFGFHGRKRVSPKVEPRVNLYLSIALPLGFALYLRDIVVHRSG